TLTAFLDGNSVTATLTVQPLLGSVEFSPREVCSRTSTTGTVKLNCTAPIDEQITLTSANAEAAPVPSSISVRQGQQTATFSVTGGDLLNDADVAIRATLGGQNTSGTLTVHPIINNLAIQPATVRGGESAIGTVTLTFNLTSGQACQAPRGGLAV